jgi:hypothetical protein
MTPGGLPLSMPSIPEVPESMDVDGDREVGRSQNHSDTGSTADVGLVLPTLMPAV